MNKHLMPCLVAKITIPKILFPVSKWPSPIHFLLRLENHPESKQGKERKPPTTMQLGDIYLCELQWREIKEWQ